MAPIAPGSRYLRTTVLRTWTLNLAAAGSRAATRIRPCAAAISFLVIQPRCGAAVAARFALGCRSVADTGGARPRMASREPGQPQRTPLPPLEGVLTCCEPDGAGCSWYWWGSLSWRRRGGGPPVGSARLPGAVHRRAHVPGAGRAHEGAWRVWLHRALRRVRAGRCLRAEGRGAVQREPGEGTGRGLPLGGQLRRRRLAAGPARVWSRLLRPLLFARGSLP